MLSLPQLPAREDCRACPLHETAKHVGVRGVWLEGSLPPGPGVPAVIMLGRNPGRNENEQGIPFVGRSGGVLRNGYLGGSTPIPSLASVYLLNAVRCFTVADAEPNWSKHVKPCWAHTQTDLKEITKCHVATSADNQKHPITEACLPSTVNPSSYPISVFSPLCMKLSIVCLGGLASQAFVSLGLGEAKPKSQAEAFRNNAREVKYGGWDVFLLHTYHPAFYLRNPNAGAAIQDHMLLLIDWLQGKLVAPSEPTIVPPRLPKG